MPQINDWEEVPIDDWEEVPITNKKSKVHKSVGGFIGNVGSDAGVDFLKKYNPGDVALAPFEAALSLGSGMAGAVVGQVAGNVNALFDTGNPDWGKRAQRVKDTTQEIMTYRPNTELGRDLADSAGSLLSLPFQAMTYPAQKAGEFLEEKGHPNAGYIVKDAGQSLAMAAYPEAMKKGGSLARLAGDKTKTMAQAVFDPKPTPEHAVRQIFKGKEADTPKLKKSLDSIDIRDVKSSKELQKRFDDAIPTLSKQVDAILAKDNKLYTLDELSTKMKDAEGNTVTQNYVSEALSGLKNLYEKTQAPLSEVSRIQKIIEKADTKGLTKVEINNIAREYGNKYDAFNKAGELSTGVNPIKHENIRSNVKNIARSNLSDAAKEIDAELSNVYTARDLLANRVKAYNNYLAKNDPQSPLSKAAEIYVLKDIKGWLKSMFKDQGMTALDLEKKLSRNLKIAKDSNLPADLYSQTPPKDFPGQPFMDEQPFMNKDIPSRQAPPQVQRPTYGMALLKPQELGARSRIPEKPKGADSGNVDISPVLQHAVETGRITKREAQIGNTILTKLTENPQPKPSKMLSAAEIAEIKLRLNQEEAIRNRNNPFNMERFLKQVK